jgi:hypothetical protein
MPFGLGDGLALTLAYVTVEPQAILRHQRADPDFTLRLVSFSWRTLFHLRRHH